MASPESSVSSLLAASGRLRGSVHPEPVPTITYKHKLYTSASEALDAYIGDFQKSLRDTHTSTGTLELRRQTSKPLPRKRDVLKTSLTDGELNFLNIPVRKRDSDGFSVTTDDLLALPNDGSLPVTRTSALLSRSGSFPMGLSFNSSSRAAPKQRPAPPASRNCLPVDDLLTARHQAPPPKVPPANQTQPLNTPRSACLPRWMTSQKSEMDFSGMTSVPDLKYPLWLRQCDERVPSWVAELDECGRDTKDAGISSPICRAERMLNGSGDTEDALDADRSWDNPPVPFKSPVPVGGADEPETSAELQRSKSAASRSSGYSSRKHPGAVEALKHMLFRLQAVEHKISQSHASAETHALEPVSQEETEETDESLRRALHHLDRLKTLVDDINQRKSRAEDHGTDCRRTSAANITDARVEEHL